MIPVATIAAGQAIKHRRKIAKVVAIGLAAQFFLLAVPLLVIVGGSDTDGATPAAGDGCAVTTSTSEPAGNLPGGLTEPDQVKNASTIIAVGKGLGVPAKGWTIAVATALVESNLHNLNWGDRDSLGLFQQRPSTGWGTPEQITETTLSTQAFYGRAAHTGNTGLLDIPGWESMPLTVAAQKVQRSAFPNAYAGREQQAATIVAALSGVTDGVCTEQPGGTGPWRAPLVKGVYQITSPFGPRNMGDGSHSGVDLGAPCGTPIYAPSAGRIIFAGATSGGMSSYGNLVAIDHGGKLETRYGHQTRVVVKAGQTVTVGQQIGYVGNTGNSFGCHLHYEIRPNSIAVDPVPFMAKKGVTL